MITFSVEAVEDYDVGGGLWLVWEHEVDFVLCLSIESYPGPSSVVIFLEQCVPNLQAVLFTEVDESISPFVSCSISEGTDAGLPCLTRPYLNIEVPHDDFVVGLAAGVEAVNILIHHFNFLISVHVI